MENRSICNLNFNKSFKSDHIKSVKNQEKTDQYNCKKGNLYMHRLDKFIHLNSDEPTNHHIKIWC